MKRKILREVDVGGKTVTVAEDENFYYVFEGKKEIYKFIKLYISKKILWDVSTDYIKYLKALQNEFLNGDLPIDNITKKIEKEVEEEFTKRLRDFFKQIPQNKKEAFLGLDVFGSLNKAFSGFNDFINQKINNILQDLKINIVDDNDDVNQKTDVNTKKILTDKVNIMKKNIADNIKQTKDVILNDIKNDLTNSMAADVPISTIQKDIEKKYNYRNGVGWKSRRTIQTSIHNANTLLKLNKWQNMGFKKFEWLTRNDPRVRDSHRKKNHRAFSIEKALKDTKNPDAYPGKAYNCRCTAIPYE